MPIAFAICFFIYVALSETLRHGVFGLSPSEISAISYVALALGALLILRADILFTLRPPRHALYGDARLNWTWTRTAMGLVLGPLLWIIPVAYGVSLIQINIGSFLVPTLIEALLYEVVMVAIAVELFFREAAIKAFQGNVPAMILASSLAYLIFHIPAGVPAALIAAGSGLYFLTLRLIGTNILAVALLHGATVIVMTQIIPLGLTGAELWRYSVYFAVAAVVLSMAVLSLFIFNQRDLQHA
ncbi:CPBP family glutamic-type intramembrane protease [Arenibacterium sp. CAU 1754]